MYVPGGEGGVQGVGPVQAPMSSDNFDVVIDFYSATPGTPVPRRPSVLRLRNENPKKKLQKNCSGTRQTCACLWNWCITELS